ncbi:class I histocompatibility antigen, Gogo-A*0401 alpha chain-like [Alligator mississippiensis]|uniref:class I histocompatibility antigen, Gogo-A*0401 alpha chain-like n=1 Tax=Alligator mississippiensis TaxID=8496 RepID=UPI002877920E|nr:class I histocompatibility antigen, Gogo-A*0401 alpha chain-like [Alligator mississippiensis]
MPDAIFHTNLVTLQHCYNQSRGSHTLQLTYGCELHEDNSTGGHMQFGYDGGDFISYDLAARTWIAGTTQAQRTQHSWNEDTAMLQSARAYLEETCITWLWQYLQHGEAALQSRHSKHPRTLASAPTSADPSRSPTGSHFYHHFYTGVSNPSTDVSRFTAVGYVDDQQILHYDSETRRQEPCRDWVQGAVDPDFWDGETVTLRGWQRGFAANLVTLQHHYNQSRGSRPLQLTYGCELHEGHSTGGHMQFGYDGGDFISYDPCTHTWVAGTTQAQCTQYKWNEAKAMLQSARAYLEETCIVWLRQYLQHGEAALQSKRPVAQMSDRPSSRDGRTTLSCRVHSFYPKDVAVIWLQNGEAQPQETSRSGVLPSGDGTYQTWATIEIDSSSNHSYTCSVEHVSLGAALRVAWDKGRTESDPAMIVGIVIGAVLVTAMVAGAAISFLISLQDLENKASEKEAVESSGSNSYSDSCIQESRDLRGAGDEGSRFQRSELRSSGARVQAFAP